MNSCTIIGNLTRDPEYREVPSSSSGGVCNFTVAVNRRGSDDADFFRIAVWGKLGEVCAQYLAKGRKVYVRGAVSASAYVDKEDEARASLEITAQDVEFLSPKADDQPEQKPPQRGQKSGYRR